MSVCPLPVSHLDAANRRAADDLGISVLLDLDGKFATANENDLIGFGISKPVDIAGSQVGQSYLLLAYGLFQPP